MRVTHECSENKDCNFHVRIPLINLNVRIFLERSEDKNLFLINRIDSSSVSLYIVRMAEEVLIKIKQVNECNALAFVEREKLYLKHFKRSDQICSRSGRTASAQF